MKSIEEVSLQSLVRSQVERRRENPHKYFLPNGKCAEFIELVGSDKVFVCLLSGGNGTSKTSTGVNIMAHIIYGPSGNKYFDFPLFNKFPYPKRGRIASDPTTIQQVIIPELKKWFPKGRYTSSKAGKNFEHVWQTDTGFKFDLMTYEQDVEEFESATLGVAWFDEPPSLAIFKATVARMRRGGIIFITATPLTGAWMYDHIITKNKGDFTPFHKWQRQRDYIYIDVEDNCKQHGVNGYLEHPAIERMIAEYDEEDKQARVHGRFHHLLGLVFKMFDRKIHVIKPFRITKRDFVVVQALDPHPRVQDAVSWIAIDRKGTKFIIDELWIKAKTSELAHRINKKDDLYRIELHLIDPIAFNEDKHQDNPAEQTLAAQLYNDYDLDYRVATKDRVRADRRIKDALDYQQVGKEIIVAPELYVFDTCTGHIFEFEHHSWEEWSGKTAERKDPKAVPEKKHDHFIENVGRILVQEQVFTPMSITPTRTSIGVKKQKDFDPFA